MAENAELQAAALWAQSDSSSGQYKEPEGLNEGTYQPDSGGADTDTAAYLQQPSSQEVQGPASSLPEPTEPSSPEQEMTPRASVEEYSEASANSTVAQNDSMPGGHTDRAAANLSKELRKLQAESAVLQEHSRRLQEKAAVIQQQRTSSDQVRRLSLTMLSALLAAHIMSDQTFVA